MPTSQVLMRQVYPDLYGLEGNDRVLVINSFSELKRIFGTSKANAIIRNNMFKGNITEAQVDYYFGDNMGEDGLGRLISLPSFKTTISGEKVSFAGGRMWNKAVYAFMTKITDSTSKVEHKKKIYQPKAINAINSSNMNDDGKTRWLNGVGSYLGKSKIQSFIETAKGITSLPLKLAGKALIIAPLMMFGIIGAALLAINMISKTNIQTPYGGIQGRK